ncbi:hypothetical protein ACH0AH_07855 [Microbacterium paludicola]|uniref:hypothetical protein n=1 Tax=Microbacterium paludicola TaxID=300019 RepID=UPI003879AAAF
MNAQELAKRLNGVISYDEPDWANLGLWPGTRHPSQTHRALSSILTVIGDAEPLWASTTVDFGTTNDFETASFDVAVWTGDLVVRAERKPAADWPVVAVVTRKALTGLRVLESPSTTGVIGSHDRGLKLELAYPSFTVTAHDRGGHKLPDLMQSFVDDLKA